MKKYDLMHDINGRGVFLMSKVCIPHLLQSAEKGMDIFHLKVPVVRRIVKRFQALIAKLPVNIRHLGRNPHILNNSPVNLPAINFMDTPPRAADPKVILIRFFANI